MSPFLIIRLTEYVFIIVIDITQCSRACRLVIKNVSLQVMVYPELWVKIDKDEY